MRHLQAVSHGELRWSLLDETLDSSEKRRRPGIAEVDSGVQVLRVGQLKRVEERAFEFEREKSGRRDAHCDPTAVAERSLRADLCTLGTVPESVLVPII